MRLWGYYAWHSFINTIKKMFRSTFVVVILAIVGMGVIFGVVGGIIGTVAEKQSAQESVDENYREDEEEEKEQEEKEEPMSAEDVAAMKTIVETVVALVFIVFLLWGLYSGSKKGTEIFLMADVNFLFTAPMKPQSVLMFRLTFQMATTILASVYLLFQIPNLINMGLGASAIASVFVGWIMLLLFQRLMMVLSYTVFTTHEQLKKYVLPIIVAIAAILLAVTAVVCFQEKGDVFAMMNTLYASSWSRWIPFVGWYKGMIMSAVNADMAHFLIFLLLMLASMAVFVWLIWQLKADFYEDALTQAGKTAEKLEAAKEGRASRAKERSKRIRRTGSFGGSGGSVFFTKEMYDRKRNAYLGFVTGTMLFYLAVSVMALMFVIRVMKLNSFFVPGIILMAILFFRNFGNPIARETSMNWLFLVPDSPYRKVFFALMAGTAGTAIDLLPALIAGIILTGENPLVMIGWLLTLVVMDFMLSTFGLLLEALLPASALDVAKSVLQMMLRFFMILVITVLMAVGFLIGGVSAALLMTTAGGLIIGGLCFLAYPSMLHGGIA